MAPVKLAHLVVAASMMSLLSAASDVDASTVTLGFDDIGNGAYRTALTGDYGGLAWGSNWWVQPYGYYNGARGNKFQPMIPGTTSLQNVQHVVNLTSDTAGAPGAPVELTSSIPFYFEQVYLTGYRFSDSLAGDTARTVTIYGYDSGGNLAGGIGFIATLDGTMKGFSPGWNDPVVKVVFAPDGTSNNRIFLLDNLSVQFVPLPAGGLLLASAIATLPILHRRRRTRVLPKHLS